MVRRFFAVAFLVVGAVASVSGGACTKFAGADDPGGGAEAGDEEPSVRPAARRST